MKKDTTTVTDLSVGLDVHKGWIRITPAEAGALGAVHPWGRIAGDLAALDQVVRKPQRPYRHLRFIYEAAPAATSSIGI